MELADEHVQRRLLHEGQVLDVGAAVAGRLRDEPGAFRSEHIEEDVLVRQVVERTTLVCQRIPGLVERLACPVDPSGHRAEQMLEDLIRRLAEQFGPGPIAELRAASKFAGAGPDPAEVVEVARDRRREQLEFETQLLHQIEQRRLRAGDPHPSEFGDLAGHPVGLDRQESSADPIAALEDLDACRRTRAGAQAPRGVAARHSGADDGDVERVVVPATHRLRSPCQRGTGEGGRGQSADQGTSRDVPPRSRCPARGFLRLHRGGSGGLLLAHGGSWLLLVAPGSGCARLRYSDGVDQPRSSKRR